MIVAAHKPSRGLMKAIGLFACCLLQGLYGFEATGSYFSYLEQLQQPLGDWRLGEIEVLIDREAILGVQALQEKRLLDKGFSAQSAKEYSRVGVVSEDHYWLWLRDAVHFPSGALGTYDRLLWKRQLQPGACGVAVLPVLPSGELVLNLNYRHATRSWEIELPRGGVEVGEALESAAYRELKEETGLESSELILLGYTAPDTGVLGEVIPVYMGKVHREAQAHPEESEAIAGTLHIKLEVLNRAFLDGFLEVSVGGQTRQVPLRDSFLTFALFQAHLRGLL